MFCYPDSQYLIEREGSADVRNDRGIMELIELQARESQRNNTCMTMQLLHGSYEETFSCCRLIVVYLTLYRNFFIVSNIYLSLP